MMRQQAGLSVSRFCQVAGIPRASWYRRARRAAEGRATLGPWPAPVRDRIEQPAAQLALEWPAWGRRKIHALLAVDGFTASQATVRRALARRGLLQLAGYQRERGELAKARKAAFVTAPSRRNRVWQADFSELETAGGGTWQMSGVIDDGPALAEHVESYLDVYNRRGPHEAPAMSFPIDRYTAAPADENTAETTPKIKESILKT